MAKLNWRSVGWIAIAALPMGATGQFTFGSGLDTNQTPVTQPTIGGTAAFDLIQLNGLGPGIPLRKGNLMPGSERVQLDNLILQNGPDYGMDYVSGVVYLKRAIRPGMSLTVYYRYDDKAPQQPAEKLNGIATMKMDLMPGQFGLLMGMGMAERGLDGTTSTTNLFGFNNNMTVGGSNLKGLLLYGQKQKINSTGLMGYQEKGAPQDYGSSSLIMQNLSSKIGSKGSFEASYQDVSKNFNNFGSALAAGYDAKVVDQLAREKGLKRMSFGFKDLSFGTMSLNQNFRSVKDGSKSIDWRSFGLKQNGVSLNYSSQHVDSGFSRFGDLAEADRDQLAREAGMTRQNFSGEIAQKFGKVNFSQSSIDDGAGNGIDQQKFSLDTSKLKFTYGNQKVGKNFSKIANILPNEQALYAADLGVHRQWMSFDATLAAGMQPLHYSAVNLQSESGTFHASDISIGSKTFSLEHSSRDISQGFANFGALNASADADLKSIANMYGKDVAPTGDDKAIYLRTANINRNFTRFSLTPAKDVSMQFGQLRLGNNNGDSSVSSFSMKTKKTSFDFRKQKLDVAFDPNQLMSFERAKLGVLPGLDQTDMAFSMDLGGNRKLAIATTDAKIGENGMSRDSLKYTDKKINIEANMRSVGAHFDGVSQLNDPERDFLTTLKGFNQRDLKVQWQILPSLKLDAQMYDANSDELSQQKMLRNIFLQYKPNEKMEVSYLSYRNKLDDPTALLFANSLERFSFFKDLGRLGKVSYLKEKISNDGTQTTTPDSSKETFAYETKIDAKTSVRTEQTKTNFDNGDKENISANTISTEISKRVGVSVSDVAIDRGGTDRDEKKRNYGFWLDFGKGLRFNWGYARQLNGDVGAMQSTTSITGGNVGNWHLGDSSYNVNSWDQDARTQAASKFSLGTIKPFKMGFLKDVMLNVGLDSASDQARWIRENKSFSFAGKMGTNQLGFNYLSQVAADGQRGIDRAFSFKTDQGDKRWLKGSFFYKVRTLPDGKQLMIRDISYTLRPTKTVEITNSLQTNPEQPNGGVMLGTLPSADRKNHWSLDYKPNPIVDPHKTQLTFGATWDELINDQTHNLSRTGGATFKIAFGNSKLVKGDDQNRTTLQLFYGLEQNNTDQYRRLAQRYSLQFDQRPGPNQTLSLLFGNLSYEHNIADGFSRNNWTVRADYQIRF